MSTPFRVFLRLIFPSTIDTAQKRHQNVIIFQKQERNGHMKKLLVILLCAALLTAGCSTSRPEAVQKTQEEPEASAGQDENKGTESPASPTPKSPDSTETEPLTNGRIIVLDPGHSAVVAEGTEPLGPGSSEYKSADASGTAGVSTGIPEYELTLSIALQLRQELTARGYTVLMTRESNDVPISCIQRADVANNAGADAYVRIHANGSEDPSATGAMTICTTPQSPYVPGLYTASRHLSDCILEAFCASTGCTQSAVWETDSMSGNNWSRVPVTILEMGYMSNPQEDELLQTPEYQQKIVQGTANGIDAFCGY